MKLYWIKTHAFVRWLFPSLVWKVQSPDTVYLTFDDGPTPEVTHWVLDQLAKANCKATFFCIGNNANQYPEIVQRIIQEGHAVGNHTQHHCNGWKTSSNAYLTDVYDCQKTLHNLGVATSLFRPPYGKITRPQIRLLLKGKYRIIMWDILTADFDKDVTPKQCAANVTRNLRPGSIVVFHDSVKAWPNLKEALPETLAFIKEKGYQTEAL